MPFSWWKLPIMIHALTHGGCAEVLWMDADATWLVPWKIASVAPAVPLVALRDTNGLNAGVLLANRRALPLLQRLWDTGLSNAEARGHPWWEQGALRSALSRRAIDPAAVHLLDGLVDYVHWQDRPLSHLAGCPKTEPRCRTELMRRLRAYNDSVPCVTFRTVLPGAAVRIPQDVWDVHIPR